MAYMDFPKRDITTKFHGTFILNDLYKKVTSWAKKNQYDAEEQTYDTKKDGKEQHLKLIIELDKKVSDYAKIGMFVKIICTDIKNIKQKNKIVQEGEVTVLLTTYVKKDYEDTWSRRATPRFLREIYDKYIAGAQFDKFEKAIADDVLSLKNTLKDFFRAPMPKK